MEKPFSKHELYKYSFRNVCRENDGLELEDGTEKIFLSAEGTADDISEGLKSFLKYLTNQKPESDFTRRLEDAVQKAKGRKEWSTEYMTLNEIKKYEREEGLEEGREEGKIQELIDQILDGFVTEEAAAGRAKKKYGMDRQEFMDRLAEARNEADSSEGD